MDSTEITFIKDLDLKKGDVTIKVRILRMWKQADFKNLDDFFSTELILMDEEGTKIQANVLKRWIPHFGRNLSEGVALYIANPGIAAHLAVFKYGLNPNKLGLYYKTQLTPCKDFKWSTYGFVFADYMSIFGETLTPNVSIDVIGDVLSYATIDTHKTSKGDVRQKMTVQLQDLDGKKIFITLWGSYAEEMSNFVKHNPDHGRVIVILQFASLKYWKGSPSISTWFEVSKLYINNDIQEINEFREKMLGHAAPHVSSEPIAFVPSLVYSIQDDFLVKTSLKSIVDIIKSFEVNSYIVVATVIAVEDKYSWYYLGCKTCHRKARKSDETKEIYVCDSKRCKGLVVSVVPRFKIPLYVEDETGILSLTLFDYEAFKLFGKTAQEFYDSNQKVGNGDLLPQEIKAMINKMYAFKIEVKEYNLKHGSLVFSISKITNDDTIISGLKKRVKVNESDSTTAGLSDFSSAETKLMKDADGSITGENSTPSTLGVSNAQTPPPIGKVVKKICSNRDSVKRILDDVYDLDDPKSCSATKHQKVSGDPVDPACLLVPKTEK